MKTQTPYRSAALLALAACAGLQAAVLEPLPIDDPINLPVGDCQNPTIAALGKPSLGSYPIGSIAQALALDYCNSGRPAALPAGLFVEGDSRINNGRASYQHKAVDLGASGALSLARIHNYRDSIYASSFGPGVFSQYDTQVVLDGTTDVRYFNPLSTMMQVFRDKNSSSELLDGVFVDPRVRSARSLTLYSDAPSQPLVNKTTSHNAAKTVVLTHWSNIKEVFEVFDLAGNPSKPSLRGRLLRVIAANGTVAYSVNYAYLADGSDLPVTVGREALWQKTSVVGGPSNPGTVSFTTYGSIVGNSYPVASATLNGQKADYYYNTTPMSLDPSRPKVKVKNVGSDKSTKPVIEVLTQASIYGLANIVYTSSATGYLGNANFALNINWNNKTQVLEYNDAKAFNYPRALVYYTLPLWWKDGTSSDASLWLDEALDKAEAQVANGQTPTDVQNQTAGMIRMLKDYDAAATGYRFFYYNVLSQDVTGYYVRVDPATAHLAAINPFFNGPQFIRYTTAGGYPRETRYAADISAVAQANAPRHGRADIVEPTSAIINDVNDLNLVVWGNGEGYLHDVYRRVHRIFNGIDTNKNNVIDSSEPKGLYRDAGITHNDSTGVVKTTITDSTTVPSTVTTVTWQP